MPTPSPSLPSDFKSLISDPSSSLCGNFIATLLKLPVTLYKYIAWFLDDTGNVSQNVVQAIIPPGTIFMSGSESTPTGWLFCDGSAVSRTTYSALFAAIGTSYGPGDGTNTFNIPDGRDVLPLGAGGAHTVGERRNDDSAKQVTLIEGNLPKHRHFFGISGTPSLTALAESGFIENPDPITWNSGMSGGGGVRVAQTRDVGPSTPSTAPNPVALPIPPSFAVNFIIKS